jgi:hypothetical protein
MITFIHKPSHIPSIILALFLLSLASEQRLMAYADPGSGAMFVQIILASFIGGLFRINSLIKRFRSRKKPQAGSLNPAQKVSI